MKREVYCYEVVIEWRDMDMSGGDAIDGPRWTGGHISRESRLAIVAENQLLAESGAIALFYEHQLPHVKATKQLHEVNAIVQLTR